MFSTIIFDVDDTLVYYEGLKEKEWYEEVCLPSCRSLNIKISLDVWNSLISGKLPRDWPESFGVDAKIFWKTIDEYNYKFRVKMWKEGRIKKYEDTKVLEKIDANIIAYSVSSTKCAEFSLKVTSLRKFFSSVYGKDLDDYKFIMQLKPQPGMLLEILRREGIRNQECIVIGDSWRDYISAKRAGCRAIIVDRNGKYVNSEYERISTLWNIIRFL